MAPPSQDNNKVAFGFDDKEGGTSGESGKSQPEPDTLEKVMTEVFGKNFDFSIPTEDTAAPPAAFIHVPVKNLEGSVVASRAVVRQANRPNPVRTKQSTKSSCVQVNHNIYEDFGRYIAAHMKELPTKSACILQSRIASLVLAEVVKSHDD